MNPQEPRLETRLESWKEIGAYLQRDATTVRRWEKEEGLPVHRHSHKARSSVYAYPSEIDAWRAGRTVVPEPVARPLWRIPAFALTMLLCLVMVGNGVRSVSAQQAAGITTRQVWSGREVNLYGTPSPDGRFLTYTDWDAPALAIRDLTTGASRRLAQGSWENPVVFPSTGPFRFSPDGSKVVSAWFNEKGQHDLRVIPVNAGRAAGEPRVVFRNDEFPFFYPVTWSARGESILASLYRKDGTTAIGLITERDGSLKILKSLEWRVPGMVDFSPDGRYIAYDARPEPNAGNDVYILTADGSREVRLIDHPADDQLLGWTPDGKYVLFSSDRTGKRDAWLAPVSDGKPSGEPQLVKRDIGQIQPMGFTRDGAFYYGLHAGIRDIYTATIDSQSGRLLEPPRLASQRVLGSNRGPAWSPDGEQLAYFVSPTLSGKNPTSLVVRSLKTGVERELTGTLRPNLNLHPHWSRDAQWLLVNSRNGRGGFGLYRVNVKTGAVSAVHDDSFFGDWAPDGRSIVYATDRAVRIRSLDTGTDRDIYRAEQVVSNLAVSPNGRLVAFGLSPLSPIVAQSIAVVPLEGGQPRDLLRGGILGGTISGLEWAPDGAHLFFTRKEKMWRISAEGGEPEPIVGLSPNGSDGFSVHPDGRRIAFISGESKEEVWMMENILPRPSESR